MATWSRRPPAGASRDERCVAQSTTFSACQFGSHSDKVFAGALSMVRAPADFETRKYSSQKEKVLFVRSAPSPAAASEGLPAPRLQPARAFRFPLNPTTYFFLFGCYLSSIFIFISSSLHPFRSLLRTQPQQPPKFARIRSELRRVGHGVWRLSTRQPFANGADNRFRDQQSRKSSPKNRKPSCGNVFSTHGQLGPACRSDPWSAP